MLRVSEVQRILGGNLDAGQIFRLLKRLGFELIPEGQADAQFRVQIPSWRLDVEREIDVIEEIARLHGYDKFENTLPAYSGAVRELPHAAVDATFRERALALGYNEALSLTFISHADAEKICSSSSAQVLELENPLSEEASVMRTSLVPGMLDMLAWNLNRDVAGRTAVRDGQGLSDVRRRTSRAAARVPGRNCSRSRGRLPVAGALDVSKGEHAAAAEIFRGFKGDVENSVSRIFRRSLSMTGRQPNIFIPADRRGARLNGAVVAQFGQIHPEVAAARKLRQDVFLAEIDLDATVQNRVAHVCGSRRSRNIQRWNEISLLYSMTGFHLNR